MPTQPMAGPLRAKLKVEPPAANPVRLAAGRRLIFGLVRPRLTHANPDSPSKKRRLVRGFGAPTDDVPGLPPALIPSAP
jgi:hypothetical protein